MSREARGQWFASAMQAIARRLPFGLSEVVPPNVVGYLLINGCTFCLDLGLLTLFYSGFGVWLPLAVTLSYGIASLVSYTCNRIFNFQSHAPVGTQLPLYVGVLVINYLVFVEGGVNGLHALGVAVPVARVLAACCEGVFLYCCMRWLVFRDAMGNNPVGPHHAAEAADSSSGPAGAASAGTVLPGTVLPGTAGSANSAPASEPRAGEPRPVVPARREGA
jgi:putative flippase GtrA